MIKLDLFDYYRQAKDNNILISFMGAFSQEILVEMGAFIRNKISLNKKIKKIFSVFIELAQNIMRYSDEKEIIDGKETGVGVILFTESPSRFHIFSGNVLGKDKTAYLAEILDNINSMNADDLKAAYGERIRIPADDSTPGAGLGLLEIARKAQEKIIYKINDIDENYSFLELSVNINKD